jgi:hypothetical protein
MPLQLELAQQDSQPRGEQAEGSRDQLARDGLRVDEREQSRRVIPSREGRAPPSIPCMHSLWADSRHR